MIGYVTQYFDGTPESLESVRELLFEIQDDDWDNCYVSPVLAFPYNPVTMEDEKNLLAVRLDLLMVCDMLIVNGDELDYYMRAEIDFAKLVGMDIYYV